MPRVCPFGSLGSPTCAGEVDSARFNGRQEGARHKGLKNLLCQMLSADPNIATAECEVLVTGIAVDGRATWRRPDVLAVSADGRSLAFDVQIASPLLATIDGRERFNADQGIAWHWIVDANQPQRLHLQGLQDLIMPQACRVLGFNEEIAAVAKTANRCGTAFQNEPFVGRAKIAAIYETGHKQISKPLVSRYRPSRY